MPGQAAPHVVLADADGHGDLVGGGEAYSPDVARKAIRVGFDEGDRIRAVAAVDLRSLGYGDAILLREDHQFARAAAFLPALADGRELLLPDLVDFLQAFGMVVENFDGRVAEMVDDAVGEHRPDAVDESAREIPANALGGLRRDALDGLGLELPPVHGIFHPNAFGVQFLAFPDGHAGAQHGNLLLGPVSARRRRTAHLEDAVAVLVVAEHDGLDGAIHRPFLFKR